MVKSEANYRTNIWEPDNASPGLIPLIICLQGGQKCIDLHVKLVRGVLVALWNTPKIALFLGHFKVTFHGFALYTFTVSSLIWILALSNDSTKATDQSFYLTNLLKFQNRYASRCNALKLLMLVHFCLFLSFM